MASHVDHGIEICAILDQADDEWQALDAVDARNIDSARRQDSGKKTPTQLNLHAILRFRGLSRRRAQLSAARQPSVSYNENTQFLGVDPPQISLFQPVG
ncbi:MAG: hypothetical protein R3E68_12885 [Burkholderiaceae bacterium]